MRILLDTHILEWMIRAPSALKARERGVIADPAHVLLLSPISIWEFRMKWEAFDMHGRRRGLIDPAAALSFVNGTEIQSTSLTAEDCAALLTDPLDHNDPFDQMLLVHAQRLGAKLLTRDGNLQGHPLVVQL